MSAGTFQIILTNPVVRPGDKVRGYFHIRTLNPIKAKHINITIDGNGKCRIWNTGEMVFERYVDEKVCVWNSGNQENILPTGNYRFPFEFTIPKNAAPSFEDRNVTTKFNIEGKIKQGFFRSITAEKEFIVKPLPLKLDEMDLSTPLHDMRLDDTLISGSVLIEVHADKETIEQGDLVRFGLQFRNESVRTFVNVTAKLVQTATYNRVDPRRYNRNFFNMPQSTTKNIPLLITTPADHLDDDLSRQGSVLRIVSGPKSDQLIEFGIFIPDFVIGTCKSSMMDLSYQVVFTIRSSDPKFAGLDIPHPVVIGKLKEVEVVEVAEVMEEESGLRLRRGMCPPANLEV